MPHTQGVTEFFRGRVGKPYGPARLSSGSGVVLGHAVSPFVAAYPWVDGVGFGTKHANPATLPGTLVAAVAFTPSGDTVFLGFQAAPFCNAYPFDRTTGFGTKYANPGTAINTTVNGAAVRSLASAPTHHVALANVNNPPNQNVYQFGKTGTGWSTRFANPATAPGGDCRGVDFTLDGLHIAYSSTLSPFVTAYPWSNAGYGVKYANPAVLPVANSPGVRFSKALPTGGAIIISQLNNTEPSVAWSFSAGFGAKFAAPLLPPGWGAITGDGGIGVTRQGLSVIIGHSFNGTFGGYTGWNWTNSGGFGTRYATISPVPAGLGRNPSFNESGTAFFGALSPSPFIMAKRFTSNVGFGTSYSNPAVLPPSTGHSIAIAS